MSKKKILVISGIVVLVLIIVGVAFVLGKRSSKAPTESPSPTNPETIIKSPSSESTISPSPTAKATPKPTPTPTPTPTPAPVTQTLTLGATASLDGWRASNGGSNTTWYLQVGHNSTLTERSFVSFDISSIPSGVTVDKVTLRLYQKEVEGTPYTSSLIVDHVNYGAGWSATPYDGSPLVTNIGTLTDNPTIEWKDLAVTASVKDDIANARGRAQFGLRFATETTGADAWARFTSADNYLGWGNTPQLVITYH